MLPERLPNGNLLVPMRAEGEDGLVGDSVVEIGPEHPHFVDWEEFLHIRLGATLPSSSDSE